MILQVFTLLIKYIKNLTNLNNNHMAMLRKVSLQGAHGCWGQV